MSKQLVFNKSPIKQEINNSYKYLILPVGSSDNT